MNTEQRSPAHEVTIIINGRQKAVAAKDLSFDELVALSACRPARTPCSRSPTGGVTARSPRALSTRETACA